MPNSGKPAMTFDLDGVVCQPPFGINVGISRNLRLPPLPAKIRARAVHELRAPRDIVSRLLQVLRYFGRQPMPEAKAALADIAKFRQPVLVTARSAVILQFVEAWLRKHDLYDCFSAIYANDAGLRSAHFKLYKVDSLGVAEHVDDDGSTAYLLARHGLRRVYLRDWPRNRGLPYPPSVKVVHSLFEVAEDLERRSNGSNE